MDIQNMALEMKNHLLETIIPFWKGIRDDQYGGYYGWLSYDLELNRKAEKGCILNSRITWFFSNVFLLYKKGILTDGDFIKYGYTALDIKDEAKHAFNFLYNKCIDKKYGGIYWSLNYDGTPADTTKHCYNQAFCVYALASYYDAIGDRQALELAKRLVALIEDNFTDEVGYLEAKTVDFQPETNEHLSENGVMADKTMNTLLHVFEAYSELYRVSKDPYVGERLKQIMDIYAEKIYNPELHRLDVFFDANYKPIIDLYSYGHDIEAAWLIERGANILGEKAYEDMVGRISKDLTESIYKVAFDGNSLACECDKGVVNEGRVWWVQAEGILGFLSGFNDDPSKTEYADAAEKIWEFIKKYIFDKRGGSEWFAIVDKNGEPDKKAPIVEPWKCPYHNGRLCIEVMKMAAGQE
jgi:mannobiose 2-epimerase